MKVRTLGSFIAMALVAVPMSVLAEPGQLYLTPFAGVEHFDSDRDISQSGVYGLGLEYRFSEHFAAELGYSMAPKAETRHTNNDVDIDRFSLDGLFYLGRMGYRQMYEPYLKLGVAHAQYDYDRAGKDEATQVNGGLGVRINFADRWSARAEALALHQVDDSQTNALYTVGVSYAFGGSPKAAPVEPAPAIAPPPPAPLDSDGDGVTDDKDKCPNTPAGREVDADGCEYVLHKTEQMRLDIKFGVDKSDVTSEYMGEVERAAKFLKRYAKVQADIEGHTDSSGSDAYNQKLSQRRADAVKKALVDHYGIAASRLTAIGHGESRPIASNATAEGREQNRRVVAVMKAEVTIDPNK